MKAAPVKKAPNTPRTSGWRFSWKIVVLALIPEIIFGVGFLWWNIKGGAEVLVEIPSGLTATQTARLLRSKGIIRSVWAFKLTARVTGMDRGLKPGEYLLRRRMSSPQALLKIHEGRVETVRIVIPEGFMAKQIANRLEANEITDSIAFMKYVRAHKLEGFLFPTTYFFAKGLSAEVVAKHMVEAFNKEVEPVFKAAGQSRFTLKQVLTLASLVQREARVIDEMPLIASVYLNRLSKRMRLEADPTVQYAMGRDTGEWFKGLRFKHLNIRSRYNTYLYNGLMPGPICSPGVEAVRSVLRPATSKKIFFVADIDGRHVFTETLKQHHAAIARIKAKKRRLKWQRKK
jgi:UPF0755 protein